MKEEFEEKEIDYEIPQIEIPIVLEWPSKKFSEALLWLSKHVPTEVTVEEVHKNQIYNHIANGGSVILLTNHESHLDHAVLFLHIVKPIQEKSRISKLWVAGNKLFPNYFREELNETDWEENKDKIRMKWTDRIKYSVEGTIMRIIAKHNDIDVLPILQGDQKIDKKLISKLVKKSLRKVERKTDLSKVITFFALEGGRDEGKVREAVSGLNRMIKEDGADHHVMYVPIGIIGTKDVLTKNIEVNLHNRVKLNVGPPFFSDDVNNDVIKYEHTIDRKDILMLRVIENLPPTKWGFYCKKQFKKYRLDHGLPF